MTKERDVSEKTKDDYIRRAFALGGDEERQRIIKIIKSSEVINSDQAFFLTQQISKVEQE